MTVECEEVRNQLENALDRLCELRNQTERVAVALEVFGIGGYSVLRRASDKRKPFPERFFANGARTETSGGEE